MSDKDSNEVIAVLSESVKGLKRLLDYNGYYLAHLMGQLSEEQFMEVEKSFVVEPDCKIKEYKEIGATIFRSLVIDYEE